MREHFIDDDGGVVTDVNFLDCKRGDFGEENAAEGIRDTCIDAGQ
jgi:hypothetical protein